MNNKPPKKILLWAAAITALVLYFIGSHQASNLDSTSSIEALLVSQKNPKSTSSMPPEAIDQFLQMTAHPILNKRTPENLIKIRSQVKSGHFKVAKKAEISSWKERGPINVAGRTRTILIDANDTSGNTVWAGSVSGGLWKTINFQSEDITWSPVNDFFQNIAISSIAQDPSNSNVMYFGTGEGWFNADAVRGLGIWKTEDGGQTWNQLTSTNNDDFSYIQKIEINPLGHVYACTKNDGIQRSTDNGGTWTKVLGSGTGGAFSDRAADIEIASNGDLYASLGIFSSDGMYKSTDGGTSWTDLISNAPNNGLPNEGFQRIEIAVAPSNEDVVYALFQSEEDLDCMGIYRTEDGGTTWVSVAVPATSTSDNFAGQQAWYDLIAKVDPFNEQTIYIGGVDLLRSHDGGETWHAISHWYGAEGLQNVHADQHTIEFYSGDNLRAIVGNDGGVYSLEIDQQKQVTPSYCIPNHGEFFEDFITNVTLNTISNQTSSSTSEEVRAYSDFTDISTSLTAGQTYIISFSANLSFDASHANAWIDWNGDGNFDAEEQILNTIGLQPYETSFTVPDDAKHISTRLRVRMQYGPDYTPDPCSTTGYNGGETEDYTIEVQNCIEGSFCDDGDNCTVNDTLDAMCNCTGTFNDDNDDDICDYLPLPEITAKNHNYNVTQFYSAAIHPDAGSNIILGGTQDNGTQLFSSEGLNSTEEVTGGDGGFCFIDQDEPHIQISTYVYNTIQITTDSWGDFETVEIGSDAGFFINPMDYDSKSNTLFSSYHPGYLARIRSLGTENIVDSLSFDELGLSKISALKVDPHVENRVWVATQKRSMDTDSKATIIAIDNAHLDEPTIAEVLEITDEQFTGTAYTRSIEISSTDPKKMIILFSNFGSPNLWMTEDGGETWINVDGNLPDVPVFWAIFNPLRATGAIIATELGIWSTDKLDAENTQWEVLTEGLANVRVDMLTYRASDQTLVAATHGRGMFTTTLLTNCDSLELMAEVVPVSCNGEEDGSISFDDQSHSYTWSTGSEGEAISNLAAGIYRVTISVGDTCDYVQTYTVEPKSNMIVSDLSIVDVSCQGQEDGSVTLEITGGIGELSYAWSNGQTENSINGLSSGDYFVTISDEDNCEITTSATVSEADLFEIIVEQVSATEALASPSGGVAPYTYQWSDPNLQTTQLAEDLELGSYSVSVIDANGCMTVNTVEITEAEPGEYGIWDIIASAGQSFSSATLQVDWTIGEMLVDQRVNNAVSLSEGFHQMFNSEIPETELPDFEVSNLVLEEAQAFIGDDFFRIEYSLANIGEGSLPENDALRSKIFLSSDTIVDEMDIEMASPVEFDIPTGYNQIKTDFLSFIIDQEAGDYYILVQVNHDQSVVESDYANNVIAEPIELLDPSIDAPDYEVISVSVNREIAFPGESIFDGGTLVIKNSGNVASPDNFAGIYLSEDENIDIEDPFSGFTSIDVLEPGEMDTFSFTYRIDDNVTAGAYNLILCVDEFDSQVEVNEDNNCGLTNITVGEDSDRPDLVISDIEFRYNEYFPGDRAFPLVHILNSGNSPAHTFFTRHNIYFSEDMTPSEDELLRSFFTFDDFLTDVTVIEDVLLSLDKSLAPGSYYIIGEADSDNQIVEANEENNLFVTEITIRDTTLRPDLIISAATVSNTPMVGGIFESSTTLSNFGDYRITESFLGVYLTQEDTLSPNAISLGFTEASAIEAGQSVEVITSFNLPTIVNAGNWNVIYAADAYFRKFESNENNNTFLIEEVEIGSNAGASFVQLDKNTVSLYPNPTTGNLFVERNTDGQDQYEIIMPNGAIMGRGTLKDGNEVPTSTLSPGLYWLVVKNENAERQILPFIKM